LDSFLRPAVRSGCPARSEPSGAHSHPSWAILLTPREAERKGLVHETVSGKLRSRTMRLRDGVVVPPESLLTSKRLVRNATETPLAQGLALERNLFLKLCISEPAYERMRSYEQANISSPSRSIVVEERTVSHD